jgi:nucleoside-diphosphate-sugar epimerase
MKTAAITGITGFIGAALKTKLVRQGVTVYGIGRNESLPEGLSELDVFFHFAREGGYFGKSFQNIPLQISNIERDCKAVEFALRYGAKRFVYAQTANYLETLELIKGNITSPRWTNVYAASKTAAEIIGKTMAYNNQLEYVSGAPCIIYGPGNRHAESFTDILLRKFIRGEDLDLIAGENLYDMVYIGDVAGAFAAIAERGVNLKTYYIGHRKLRTFKEIVTEIRDIVNPMSALNFGAYPEEPQAISWNDAGLDDLFEDTGFACETDFRESILRTVAWIKEEKEYRKHYENNQCGNSML